MIPPDASSSPATAWVIIPVHNRRDLTLRCLESLRGNGDLARFHVLVVDDGSDDGTAEAIRAGFPEVEIAAGDGTLWWTGAVDLGMHRAIAAGANAVFWLNDDCRPQRGTLDGLLAAARRDGCIAAAQPRTEVGVVFSGMKKTARGLRALSCPPSENLDVDACNGNCVCIPRAVIERIGYPDAAAFPQYHGDTDYTLRATRVGIRCVILGAAACGSEMPPSPHIESWLLSDKSFLTLWRRFYNVKSAFHFGAYARFNWRHWGARGLVLFCLPYVKLAVMRLVRAVLPRPIFIRYLASRSLYWRMQQTAEK